MYSGSSWSWSYGCWIYNYLCNKCLSPLTLWVRMYGYLNTWAGYRGVKKSVSGVVLVVRSQLL